MKRCLVNVLVFILIVCQVGYAEMFDLTSFNDEELLELRQSIEEELFQRGIFDGEEVLPGKYVVEEDIKAGYYAIGCKESYGGGAITVGVYDENTGEGDTYGVMPSEEIMIRLDAGQYLRISYGVGLVKAAEKPNFAP